MNKRSTKFRHFVLIAEVLPSPTYICPAVGVLMLYFILSQECRKSQNFSSMSSIVVTLQSLSQLMLTCDIELTKNEKQLLTQLGDILAPGGDHRAYRETLQNVKSPIAIPWLGARSPSFPLLNTNIMFFFSLFPGPGRPHTYSCPFTQPTNLLRPQQFNCRNRPTPTDQFHPLCQTPTTH